MSINYITKHEGQFEKRLMQGSLTAILETPKVNWLGAKSFELPTISVTGYKAHTRSKGYNSGTVSNDKNVYTLGFDRDVEFLLIQQMLTKQTKSFQLLTSQIHSFQNMQHQKLMLTAFLKLQQLQSMVIISSKRIALRQRMSMES